MLVKVSTDVVEVIGKATTRFQLSGLVRVDGVASVHAYATLMLHPRLNVSMIAWRT